MHNTNELTTNQALQALMFANELLKAREEAIATPKRHCYRYACQCNAAPKPEPLKQSPALARALGKALSLR